MALSVNTLFHQLANHVEWVHRIVQSLLPKTMRANPEHASIPSELPLKGTSFSSSWGLVSNVNVGAKGGHEYVVFDYDSNTGETAHSDTVVAIKAESPTTPATSASGLQLERVDEWIFAFEPERRVGSDKIESLVDDVLKLMEFAKTFPQNL